VSVPESSRCFPLLHVGPCHQFLSKLDIAPCLARFGTFLVRSSVLDELIPKVLHSTLKPYINTKLQIRHAQVNLLYHGGYYRWIRYKTYANTEGKLMARLTDLHRQHRHSTVDHGDAFDGVFLLLHLWVLPSRWSILLRISPSSLSSLWMASWCEWLSPLRMAAPPGL
jgi:hypothetical protein